MFFFDSDDNEEQTKILVYPSQPSLLSYTAHGKLYILCIYEVSLVCHSSIVHAAAFTFVVFKKCLFTFQQLSENEDMRNTNFYFTYSYIIECNATMNILINFKS